MRIFSMFISVVLLCAMSFCGIENIGAEEPAYRMVEQFVFEYMQGEMPRTDAAVKEQTLIIPAIEELPLLDGFLDPVWNGVPGIYLWDPIARRNILLKGAYANDRIFFLVSFNDSDESREMFSWHWDRTEQMYVLGDEIEDSFVFKWNMEREPHDLSIYADIRSAADIWFWKADRTDRVGYADDKTQQLLPTSSDKAQEIISRTGKLMYLTRVGDEGQGAYVSTFPLDFIGEKVLKYDSREPQGSRADVRAKGHWHDGMWTIEFSRQLITAHTDDIQFELDKEYQFGVSLNEIAGKQPEPNRSNPLYGCGDVYNSITLRFKQ